MSYVLGSGSSGGGGGSGTVTSVALTVPSFLSVGGSPITTSGTLAITLGTQTANTVFAGPSSGSAATPTFRALVAADILPINLASSANGGVTGITPLANGGTGTNAASANAAFNALSPMTTSGDIIYGGASGAATRLAKAADGTVLTLASGVPSWAAGGSGSGVTTVGTFSASAQTNGATISSTTITFGPASATVPGMVSIGTQSWAGAKTFTGNVLATPGSTTVPALAFVGATSTGYDAAATGWGTSSSGPALLLNHNGNQLFQFYSNNNSSTEAVIGTSRTTFLLGINGGSGISTRYYEMHADGANPAALMFVDQGDANGNSVWLGRDQSGVRAPFLGLLAQGVGLGYSAGSTMPTIPAGNISRVNAAVTTLTGSAGTASCSQIEMGASYKKVIIYLSGYTAVAQAYTFPTAFLQTPYVYGLAAGVSGATASTTTITFTTTTLTGFVFVEGY